MTVIHYYTNREVSELLAINLDRWKRWSRAFLPPDPLGGMQSGYARQYTFKDLFKVFFGGYLLGHLKLSVLESKQVLEDLSPWMKKNGFLNLNGSKKNLMGMVRRSESYRIYFCPKPLSGKTGKTVFLYLIRKTVDVEIKVTLSGRQVIEKLTETTLHDDMVEESSLALLDDPSVRLINLTALFAQLVRKVHP